MPYRYADPKSVLCLNGELPDKHFFDKAPLVVAADGAADKLLHYGIEPHVIIGDFDSIDQAKHSKTAKVFLPDQNKTDFQKALEYLAEQKLLPTIICGVNGGMLDHILCNISIILEHSCVFYAPPIIGQVLKEKTFLQLKLKIGTKISLFGIPQACVTTVGLKWELNRASLTFPGNNSCFNRVATEDVVIEVLKGSVLLLIYSEKIMDMGIYKKRRFALW